MHTSEIRITNPDWVRDALDFDRPYPDDDARVRVAITLARENVLRNTGGPFGAAVFEAESGRLVAVGTNGVLRLNNSSAHGEIVALDDGPGEARELHVAGEWHGTPRAVLFVRAVRNVSRCDAMEWRYPARFRRNARQCDTTGLR